jgi:hypothetical protein
MFLMLDHRLNANFRNAARIVVVYNNWLLVFKNYLGGEIHRRFMVKEMNQAALSLFNTNRHALWIFSWFTLR